MSFRGLRGGLATILGAALLSVVSCGQKPVTPDSKLVLIPFDYIGPANDLAWVGKALPGIVSVQISSLTASRLAEAHLALVRQVMQGYVTGEGGDLRVTAIVRDETTQRTVRTFEARGTSPLELASALSRQITSQPKAFGTNSSEAIQRYFSGDFESSVASDPGFGAAQLSRVEELLRSGKKDEVPGAIAAAKSARLTELDRARLQAMVATNPKERTAAFLALARGQRYDSQLWRAAAEAAMASKEHREAVEAYKKTIEFDPKNINLWNTLAYAQTFRGDFEGSKQSIAEYRKLAPKDANALDSMGELLFYQGRFEEAEKSFLEAFAMNAALLGGGDIYRAALSRYLAGDRAKADEHFRRYVNFLKVRNDPAIALRQAVWFYVTGRREEAIRAASEAGTAAAKSQIAAWELAEGKGNAAMLGDRPELRGWRLLFEKRYADAVNYLTPIYENTSVINGNETRMLLIWALAGANRASETAPLLEQWPLPPAGPEPGLSSIAVAKFIQLKAGH